MLGEVRDQAVQGVRGADEDRGGHVAAAALGLQQVGDGLRAERVGADAVDGVGRAARRARRGGRRTRPRADRSCGRSRRCSRIAVPFSGPPRTRRLRGVQVADAGAVTASPCGRSRTAGRLLRSGWSAASAQPRSSVKIHGTWPPWVSACSMTTTPPGRSSRCAVRSMPRMVSRPSSPENRASSGSWSRASGATYSHSVSGMYGGLEMTRSTWPSRSGKAVSASPWCRSTLDPSTFLRVQPQGVLGQLHGVHARARHLLGQGERDGAGAGAQVDDQRLDDVHRAYGVYGPADHRLGLRARHEHPGPDLEFQVAEEGAPGDVLERLAGLAAGDGLPVAGVEVRVLDACAARPA